MADGMDQTRISGSEVEIDNARVQSFFEQRKNKELPHRYNLVNYQDNHPERAIERDASEKERVSPYFPCRGEHHVLDVGCGVGRWGDLIVPQLSGGRYVGVDYTSHFIEVAKKQFHDKPDACFLCGSFQNLTACLRDAHEYRLFDRILVNGVLMYINDDDVGICLEQIRDLTADQGLVYIKESVGVKKRLTLKEFYSEELTASYSVIYRSIAEYSSLVTKHFLNNGYGILNCGATWGNGLDETGETSNWYWIIQKNTQS